MQKNYTVQEVAKLIGVGPNKLMAWLRTKKIINQANVPYQQHITAGHMAVKDNNWYHKECGQQYSIRPMVTASGIDWIKKQMEAEQETAA